jgi:hypothetical protein
VKIEVVLQDRMVSVARRLQVIQDALSLVVLVPAAWARIRGGHALLLGLAVLEMAAIALALLSMIRKRKLSLRRYTNGEEIRDALARGAAAMSLGHVPDPAGSSAQAPKSTIPTSG